MNTVAVGQEELGRFIRDALMAAGARTEDATIVADGLVWANLRAVDGHGVSRLPSYLKMIERGDIDVKAKPRLSQDRPATFVLDGGHGFGAVAMMQAAMTAAERAQTAGVCFGLVRETTHTGAVGRYAQWMAQRGCIAMIMGAGPAFVAYHGARVRAWERVRSRSQCRTAAPPSFSTWRPVRSRTERSCRRAPPARHCRRTLR